MTDKRNETGDADYTEHRIKHLEMIQSVVSRIAGNSAVMKRYCLITVAAGAALYRFKDEEPHILFAVAILIAVFWALDCKYLQHEKRFRDLFDQVRLEDPNCRPDFRIEINTETRVRNPFSHAFGSWTTWGFYFPLFVLFLAAWGWL